MGNSNPKEDLWQQFLADDGTVHKPAKVVSDGTEWTGEFDRRKKPRDEKPATDNAIDNTAGNLTSDVTTDLSGDAANESHIDGEPESDSDQ